MNKINNRTNKEVIYSTDPDWRKKSLEEPVNEPVKGNKPVLRISLDRKHRARKQVTLIEGVPNHALNDICKQLKSQCANGGTVKDGNIVLHGDHRKKAPLNRKLQVTYSPAVELFPGTVRE